VKKIVLLLVLLPSIPVVAADARTPSNFLRAYTQMLCAEKAGDHSAALAAISPFIAGTDEFHVSGSKALDRDYVDSAISAGWAITRMTPKMRFLKYGSGTMQRQEVIMNFRVSGHDRKQAIASLKACFGASVVEGPKNGQPPLEMAAATIAWYLTQDIDGRVVPKELTGMNRGGTLGFGSQ